MAATPAVPIKHKPLGANLAHESWRAGPSDAPVRYCNTVLYDRRGCEETGDAVAHADGSWSASNGDEDVVEDIDGSKRLITRSSELAHAFGHAAQRPGFSDGFLFTVGSTKPSSPPTRITPDLFAWAAVQRRR